MGNGACVAQGLQDGRSGPFEVVEKKGAVTYLVELKTPRNSFRVLHVNHLKPHYERSEMNMLLVIDDELEEDSEPLPDLLSSKEQDESVEGVILSPTLTIDQQRDCHQVLGQFASQFSLTPELTHCAPPNIDTGDSMPV